MNVKYRPIGPQEKLYKTIVNQIRDMIVSGELKKGDQLPSERDMATQFGVSRTAVREAIKSLSEIGLIDIMVGKGTFVANNTTDRIVESVNLLLHVEQVKIEDLHHARMVLEAPIAKLAAKNRSEENIAQLTCLIEKMEETQEQTQEFIDVDTEFHIEVARASGNTAFIVLIQAIIKILRSERTYAMDFQDQTESALKHHKQILKMIIAQDEGKAEKAMQSHLDTVNEVIQSL
jgi:GntR family transcriptional repressor for pyruvate dehydrogenase complex